MPVKPHLNHVVALVALILTAASLLWPVPGHSADLRGHAYLAAITAGHDGLASRISVLRSRLDSLAGNDRFLVIDTVHNRLQIRKGSRILRDAVCATGSGKVLLGDAFRVWRFYTPLRPFVVQRKVVDPIWKKPEWAFVEEGRRPPVLPWEFDRLDPVTLGDYALELGDGFEIHGTLYPELLGRHITHGCIRLGDVDLKAVFDSVPAGARVFAY